MKNRLAIFICAHLTASYLTYACFLALVLSIGRHPSWGPLLIRLPWLAPLMAPFGAATAILSTFRPPYLVAEPHFFLYPLLFPIAYWWFNRHRRREQCRAPGQLRHPWLWYIVASIVALSVLTGTFFLTGFILTYFAPALLVEIHTGQPLDLYTNNPLGLLLALLATASSFRATMRFARGVAQPTVLDPERARIEAVLMAISKGDQPSSTTDQVG